MSNLSFPTIADNIDYLTGKSHEGEKYPPSITAPNDGGKFNFNGEANYWPGSTFICHLDKNSDAFRAVSELQAKIRESKFAEYFTFLPEPSFHMTIFPGWCPSHWDDAFKDGAVSAKKYQSATTEAVLSQSEGLAVPSGFAVRPVEVFALHSIYMTGADDANEAKLRKARKVIWDATEIPTNDFDGYHFHVSLGYQLKWADEETAKEMVDFGNALFADFQKEIEVIEFGAVEFCTFENMHHFEPLKIFGK